MGRGRHAMQRKCANKAQSAWISGNDGESFVPGALSSCRAEVRDESGAPHWRYAAGLACPTEGYRCPLGFFVFVLADKLHYQIRILKKMEDGG